MRLDLLNRLVELNALREHASRDLDAAIERAPDSAGGENCSSTEAIDAAVKTFIGADDDYRIAMTAVLTEARAEAAPNQNLPSAPDF